MPPLTALLVRCTEKLAGVTPAGRSDSPTSKGHGSGYTTTTWRGTVLDLKNVMDEYEIIKGYHVISDHTEHSAKGALEK